MTCDDIKRPKTPRSDQGGKKSQYRVKMNGKHMGNHCLMGKKDEVHRPCGFSRDKKVKKTSGCLH